MNSNYLTPEQQDKLKGGKEPTSNINVSCFFAAVLAVGLIIIAIVERLLS